MSEYFNDSNGGCWAGTTVTAENTLGNAINNASEKDILFAINNSKNAEHMFYQCNFSGDATAYSGTPPGLYKSVGACTIPGNKYFCDYNNTWSNASAYGYQYSSSGSDGYNIYSLSSPFAAIQRGNHSYIPSLQGTHGKGTDLSEWNSTKYASLSDSSCCPDNFCWNGTQCVDGRIGGQTDASLPRYIPQDFLYTLKGQSDTSDYAIACVMGNWTKIERKFTPHSDNIDVSPYSGYCWSDSQCYYEDSSSGNKMCYNNGSIVPMNANNPNGELTDFYCDNGNWSSRTKLLADTLYQIGNSKLKGADGFSILCDDINNQKTLNSNNRLMLSDSPPIELKDAAVNTMENELPSSASKRSLCVLTVDNWDKVSGTGGIKGMFGDFNDNVIIGVPLKKGWEDLSGTNFSGINLYECSENPRTTILAGGNIYTPCDADWPLKITDSAGKDHDIYLYYNNFTKTIIFSQKSFNSPGTLSLMDKFTGWIKSILGIAEERDKIDLYKSLMHANNTAFNFSNMLYNHIYYYTNADSTKEITGIKEYKYAKSNYKIDGTQDKKYRNFIYINYKGFNNPPLCTTFNETTSEPLDITQYFPIVTTTGTGGSSKHSYITCTADNSSVMMELNPEDPNYDKNNYWPDFTSRIRP